MSIRIFAPLAALMLVPLVFPVSALARDSDKYPPADVDCVCSKCFFMDSFDPSQDSKYGAPPDGWILPVGTAPKGISVGVLTEGQPYLVTVTGTVSYFALHNSVPGDHTWESLPIVGTPVSPMYLSDGPGAPAPSDQTKAGYDWECIFAFPTWPGSPLLGVTPPYHFRRGRFSFDGGVTFTHPEPIGPKCSPTHTYNYIIVGTGAEAFVRFHDMGPTEDNYGKYKICLQPALVSPTCSTAENE